jgi:hypothetical protein
MLYTTNKFIKKKFKNFIILFNVLIVTIVFYSLIIFFLFRKFFCIFQFQRDFLSFLKFYFGPVRPLVSGLGATLVPRSKIFVSLT